MSTCSSDLSWGVLQRERLRFRAEDALRDLKRRIDQHWRARQPRAEPATT
jgi:hypothetical protein